MVEIVEDLQWLTILLPCYFRWQGDNVSHVARNFGLQVGMTEAHVKALAIKLQEEVNRRQNGTVS